jgi:hypothetical protein
MRALFLVALTALAGQAAARAPAAPATDLVACAAAYQAMDTVALAKFGARAPALAGLELPAGADIVPFGRRSHELKSRIADSPAETDGVWEEIDTAAEARAAEVTSGRGAPVFDLVRRCDRAFGFTPVLGA